MLPVKLLEALTIELILSTEKQRDEALEILSQHRYGELDIEKQAKAYAVKYCKSVFENFSPGK